MKYWWQAAEDTVVEVSGSRYFKLRSIGECVWPENRPLKNNRAVKQDKYTDVDERGCADATQAG